MRLAVLRKRVQHDGIDARRPEALDVIADRVTDNVRALEGALIRVVAFHSLTGRPLDAALAAEVLDGLYPAPPPASRQPGVAPTIELIQQLTCEAFGLTLDELVSHERTARVAWPRQVAMYLCREHTDQSLPAIGKRFGGRNHTTVMHACRRTSARLASDQDAFEAVRSPVAHVSAAPRDDRSPCHTVHARAHRPGACFPRCLRPDRRVAHTCTGPMTSSLPR